MKTEIRQKQLDLAICKLYFIPSCTWFLLVSRSDGIKPASSERLGLPCHNLFIMLQLTCTDLKIRHLTANCRSFLQLQLSVLLPFADLVELSHLIALKQQWQNLLCHQLQASATESATPNHSFYKFPALF